VEVGAPQSEVLGLGFRHLTELAVIEDDEHLARWLRESVVRIFEAVEKHQDFHLPAVVARALTTIRERCGEDITRSGVAKAAGISPSHLADLLLKRTGRTFTELVREARIDKACGLLCETESSMADVAAQCGFCDQSYFTHVFQKLKKTTPGNYRVMVQARAKTQNNPP
jgi:AraC-like DNA-binding protein